MVVASGYNVYARVSGGIPVGKAAPYLYVLARFDTEAACLLRAYYRGQVVARIVDNGKHFEREAAAQGVVYCTAGAVRNCVELLAAGACEFGRPALVGLVEICFGNDSAVGYLGCHGRNILYCAVFAEHDVHQVGYGSHLARNALGYVLVCAVHEVHLVARYGAGVHACHYNLAVKYAVAIHARACVAADSHPLRALGRKSRLAVNGNFARGETVDVQAHHSLGFAVGGNHVVIRAGLGYYV